MMSSPLLHTVYPLFRKIPVRSRKAGLIAVMLFLLPAAALCQTDPARDVLTITPDSEVYAVSPGGRTNFQLRVDLHENWHINSHQPKKAYLVPSQLELPPDSAFTIAALRFPRPRERNFAFSDEPVSVFEGTFTVSGRIRADKEASPGIHQPALEFTYQPCSDDACLSPETLRQEIFLKVEKTGEGGNDVPAGASAEFEPGASGTPPADQPAFFGRIDSAGLLLSLVLVFFGGLALNLTPCVYPIIPVTISYFGAQSEGRTRRLFLLGLLYVGGMAVTYSAIGVVTALTGAVFGGLLQQTPVILTIVAIFMLLSLGMFGAYEFKLPDAWVNRLGGSRAGFPGALFMGLTMGVIAAPCIGPFVLGLVAYVAARGDPVYGFLLFFFLSLGLGLPYLFLALFSGKIKLLPRSGQWMAGVRHIFGLVLLGMAVYFAAPLLPENFSGYALPGFGVIAAVYLLLIDRTANNVFCFKIFKTAFSVLLLGVSVFFLISTAQKALPDWQKFTQSGYTQSLENDRKMIIVFHADWCIPCRELKARTLSHPRVLEALDSFEVFQVDMTHAAAPQARQAREAFGIQGVPTVILISSQGTVVERIAGLVGPEKFTAALRRVQ
ncbi:MAG: thioredoxin family protein [Desulfobacterales bacterium]|nr:thioredoxin family protein [Desulfobacterales bacterium]MBS3756493.1 thioredoxin family protein [Desulfobacterales bacterium]